MKRVSLLAVLVLTLVATTLASAQSTLPGSGWWSGQQVQNVGTANATIEIVAYEKDNPSNTYSDSQSVAQGDAYTFTPFTGLTNLPDGFMGSAVVSADQPIKAIVNVTNLKAGSVGVDGGTAAAQYQGIDGSAVGTTVYFPLAKGDYYGATTTYYVQNAGSTAATVTADFTMRTGATYQYTTPSLEPNQMAVFSIYDDPSYSAPGGTDDDGRVGSMIATSTQPLAGVVMEHATTATPAKYVQGTRGFTSADFDTKAYAPVVKNQYFGRFSGLQVQNVGSSDIDITVTYKGADGACNGQTKTESATNVAGGTSHTFVQLGTGMGPLGGNCLASATIEATGDFVAIVNEVPVSGGGAGITYYAIPDGAATTKVSAPLFKDNYYDSTSGLQIQNVGSAAASNIVATFSCTNEDGSAAFTAISEPQSAAVGSSVQFFLPSQPGTGKPAFTAANPFSAGEKNCSVTVDSDQAVVAIVNEMGWGPNLGIDDNNYEGFNLAP